MKSWSVRARDRVGDPSGFDCGFHIVRTDDVGAFENQRRLSRKRAIKAALGRNVLPTLRKSSADE
jgi:hypothetical protein